MGKNQKKNQQPQWRFELHQSVDAIVPTTRGGGGKKVGGGKKWNDAWERRAGTGKPPNDEWDDVDPAVFCELVPTLPRDLVFSTCARERAAGAPVQEALDRLLALSLEEPDNDQGPSSQPALQLGPGVGIIAPVRPLPPGEGDTGTLRLAALPTELCGEICAMLGAANPVSLGRLAQSCVGCREICMFHLSCNTLLLSHLRHLS